MNGLLVLADIYDSLVRYCMRQKPVEACGLLSGTNGIVQTWWPIRNAENSPVSFTMDPNELEEALARMEQNNEELYALFHSHPTGPPVPSPFDLEHFHFPCSCIIVSLTGIRPRVRSYRISDGKASLETIYLVHP